MMRRFNYLKRTFLFALALTLTNCQVDETPIEQQSRIETVTINEAKTLLIQPSTAKFSKLSKEELSNLEFDKISQEKINGSDQLLTIIPYATNDKTKNERILLLKIDKEIKSVVFSMHPEENSHKDHFSGKILIYSLDGFFLNGYRAKNGIIISQFIKTTKASLTSKQDGEALKEVIVTNNYHGVKFVNYFYFKTIWGSGGSSDAGGGQGMSWDAGSSSGEANSVANSIEQNIDDTALTPCYKDVMNQLKKGTVCEIEKVFSKLDADFSKYKVTFVNGITDKAGAVADTKKTNPNVLFNYTITIGEDKYTSGTKLFKANALLHELVHAYFNSIIDDASSSSNSSGLIDTPTLFNAFVDKKYKNSVIGDIHHIEMANTYVDAISSALQEYQTGVAVPYGSALQEYKDLAWYGLLDTKVYNDKSEDERNRIKNRYDTESRGGSIGGQQLIGKPCN